MKHKYIIGVDEAGRGPLAGPVAVGVVLFLKKEYEKFKKEIAPQGLTSSRPAFSEGLGSSRIDLFRNLKDSKQLTKIQREKWFEKIKENKNIQYTVCFTGAGQIDKFGIVKAIDKALKMALKKLKVNPKQCRVLLDGSLKAPSEFINQKTIIKGDEKELVISLASIAAKVERDRKMTNLSKKYPEYNFKKHKGYGTKEHYKKIKKHGLCDIHRKSFIKVRP